MTTPVITIPGIAHQHVCDNYPLPQRASLPLPQSVLPEMIIGIDTHKDIHVAAAITTLGHVLGTLSFPTTRTGFESLLSWAKAFGVITGFGIEGTGSYGKNLTAYLHQRGYTVIEVNRGNRQTRRQSGKTDTIDAITAARTVLSGQATTTPKNHEGNVEMMRQSQIVRDHAVKNMTETINIFHDMLLSAPEEICQSLTGKTPLHIATTCSTLHKDTGHALTDNVICNLIRLSTRWLSLHREAQDIDKEIKGLVTQTKPELLHEYGIGPQIAATILVAVGDNPERIHSQAALAKLAGTCPIPASSGKTTRHRLNRGGNRKLNAAIHRIAITRMKNHDDTRNYIAKRQAEGKSKRDIIRILKRYIIRHIYTILQQPT